MNTFRVSIGLALSGLSSLAVAQQANTVNDVSFVLEEVLVTVARTGALPTQSILTSVDIAGGALVQDANADYTWELFGQMPGVILTEFNQGTTSGRFSMRAFNGEGQINAVKLLIDGVPSNSNNGSMPYLDSVFPLQIERLEVVRGTNDPRYGQHNIAGNANLVTRTGAEYQEARISYGSWNALDAQMASGYENGNFSQNYLLAFHQTDGYRDHADNKRYALSGKWFYNFDAASRIGLSLRGYKNTADEPGYLTRTQAAADPQQTPTHAANDGSERKVNQLSVFFDHAFGETLNWSNVAYRNQWDEDRFVRFSAAVSQQERIAQEKHTGMRSAMTLRPNVSALASLSVEWGAEAEWQDNIIERYTTANRLRVAQSQSQQYTFNVYGAYLQAVIEPVQWLRLVPAYRVDKLGGHFSNKRTGIRASMYDFGLISQPKLSAVVSLSPAYSLYANWGRSYQVGVGTTSYKIPPLNNSLEPSINTGWETGVKFAPLKWLSGRVSYWRQMATNEWQRLLSNSNGDSENVGETLRRGFDLQVSVQPLQQVSLWLAYANQKGNIVTPGSTEPASRGKEIDHLPHHVFSGGVDYQMLPSLKWALDFNGQTDYYLERTNITDKFGDYTRVNLTVRYQVNDALSLEGQVKNLNNGYSEYVWWDVDQTPNASMHSPGDPRSYYVAARFSF